MGSLPFDRHQDVEQGRSCGSHSGKNVLAASSKASKLPLVASTVFRWLQLVCGQSSGRHGGEQASWWQRATWRLESTELCDTHRQNGHRDVDYLFVLSGTEMRKCLVAAKLSCKTATTSWPAILVQSHSNSTPINMSDEGEFCLRVYTAAWEPHSANISSLPDSLSRSEPEASTSTAVVSKNKRFRKEKRECYLNVQYMHLSPC